MSLPPIMAPPPPQRPTVVIPAGSYTDFDLGVFLSDLGYVISAPLAYNVVTDAGAKFIGSSPASPAFTTGSIDSGMLIVMSHFGEMRGAGGKGAQGHALAYLDQNWLPAGDDTFVAFAGSGGGGAGGTPGAAGDPAIWKGAAGVGNAGNAGIESAGGAGGKPGFHAQEEPLDPKPTRWPADPSATHLLEGPYFNGEGGGTALEIRCSMDFTNAGKVYGGGGGGCSGVAAIGFADPGNMAIFDPTSWFPPADATYSVIVPIPATQADWMQGGFGGDPGEGGKYGFADVAWQTGWLGGQIVRSTTVPQRNIVFPSHAGAQRCFPGAAGNAIDKGSEMVTISGDQNEIKGPVV